MGLLLGSRRATAFDMQDVVAKAQALAKASYQDTKGQVPDWLTKITYDQWRNIRFRPEYTLWRDDHLPFQVQFFHPGFYYNRTVTINVVDAKGGVRPLAFSPSQFDYGHSDFASKVPQNLGYAGFRIHAPIKNPEYYDEVIVFLGASYLRAVGKDEVFGLSARALAIDTAEPSGEEFPYFKEFWLVTPVTPAPTPAPTHKKAAAKPKTPTASPDPPVKAMTVYALLDSPSLAGAYRFTIEPGEQTIVGVDARLFLRQEVRKLGIAPLTSMFFHGENAPRQFEDFRPEVHDSDGLLLNFESGEWLWRPIDNPRTLQVSDFHMVKPRGFGMIQRDRDFDHYQDLETHAEQRPSAWVTPHGDWGTGRVELVEIPTKSDTNDNIVAYWVPQKTAKADDLVAFSYAVSWYGDDAARPPGGRVVATRRDRGTAESVYRFVVDFAGKELDALPATTVLRGVVSVAKDDTAELLDQQVVKNPATGGWRLTFQVRPKKTPVDLRAFLDKDGNALTETWSYVLLQ
ncbi:MAG TPA: glucan biosynthesis protein G [Candidatus Margulisiibacteriota bacterium]|nr:glucan biosynthesis protein G [Candidatus Margulisiibacteriota bacterium]